jgi:putative glutamine amidotransferase
MSKLVIGYTGPSVYSPEIQEMIEEERQLNAIPLCINQNKVEDLEFVLNQVNAIILAGGSDICPLTYGEEVGNGNNYSNFDLKRDARESFIIDFAKKKDIPILGICRGHQMLGVLHDCYLMQDISSSEICHQMAKMNLGSSGSIHGVYCLENLQKEFFPYEFVNSYHHQALYFSPKNLKIHLDSGIEVIGYSNLNYKASKTQLTIIELMRGTKSRWISCQWHPEIDWKTNKASQKVLDIFKKMFTISQ